MSALLWDLDDTLLITLPGRMKALAHAHEVCLGSRTDPEALWRSHRGGSLEAMGKRLLGEPITVSAARAAARRPSLTTSCGTRASTGRSTTTAAPPRLTASPSTMPPPPVGGPLPIPAPAPSTAP